MGLVTIRKIEEKNIVGQIYGRWTVTEMKRVLRTGYACPVATVKCSCGTVKSVRLDILKSGRSKSCGCFHSDVMKELKVIHGLSDHKLYAVWEAMIQRCYNQKNKHYKNYGGRGIVVCESWKHDAKAFYDFAITNGWKESLEIDRVNNDGNYDPSNCRFVTPAENLANKRLLRSDSPTEYRGVSPLGLVFRVTVRCGKRRYSKSGFKTAQEAAIHRDQYCITNKLNLPLNFKINVNCFEQRGSI